MVATTYDWRTPAKVRAVLERFREMHPRMRLRVYYGNPVTGEATGETLEGFVTRTPGPVRRPGISSHRWITVALDDARIIRIEYANPRHGGVLYSHPRFHLHFNH